MTVPGYATNRIWLAHACDGRIRVSVEQEIWETGGGRGHAGSREVQYNVHFFGPSEPIRVSSTDVIAITGLLKIALQMVDSENSSLKKP